MRPLAHQMEPVKAVVHAWTNGQKDEKHRRGSKKLFISFIPDKINSFSHKLHISRPCFCAPVYFKPNIEALRFFQLFRVALYSYPEIRNDRDRGLFPIDDADEAGRTFSHSKPRAALHKLVLREFPNKEI